MGLFSGKTSKDSDHEDLSKLSNEELESQVQGLDCDEADLYLSEEEMWHLTHVEDELDRRKGKQ